MTRTSQSVISKHCGIQPAANSVSIESFFLSSADLCRRIRRRASDDILLLLPYFSKGGTHFFDKNGWLLKSRKVAALFGLVPVDEIGIGLLSPALWSAVYLSREDGCGDR